MRRILPILLSILAATASAQDRTVETNGWSYLLWTNVASGSWSCTTNTRADVLIVAGGGGGGGYWCGGGGGAGGLVLTNLILESGSSYSVAVGGGGGGGSTQTDATGIGTNGANSSFSNLVSVGGGGGGGGNYQNAPGQNGGSGGGGAGRNNSPCGTGTVAQGSNGGDSRDGTTTGTGGGGGGGGKCALGESIGDVTRGGAGGSGTNLLAWLSGIVVHSNSTFSGGGGGGTVSTGISGGSGGSSVGGTGGKGADGYPAINGSGSGGGGGGGTGWKGSEGGSGAIVVKLASDHAAFPTSPFPGAIVPTNSTTLSWSAPVAGSATNYLVYAGKSMTNIELIASTTQTTYGFSVSVDEMYSPVFWRIDAQAGGETATGPITCFEITVPFLKGTVIYCSKSGRNFSPYWNWINAATGIVQAISAATNGDTVLVGPGTHDFGMDTRIWPTNLTLKSSDGPRNTILVGLVGYSDGSSNVLSGLQFSGILHGGRVTAPPAGIVYSANAATTVVENCWFINCVNTNIGVGGYDQAGSIAGQSASAKLLVSNCVFVKNVARYSAVIYSALGCWNSIDIGGSPVYSFSNVTCYNASVVGGNYTAPLSTAASNVNSIIFYCKEGNTLTNPLLVGSAFYDPGGTQVWTAANTGSNFFFNEAIFGGIDAFRPKANSEIRKQNLGALPFDPPGRALAAHKIATKGN